MKLSPCARFVVLDDLHIDREVFSALARWSDRRGLRVQDGVQLAILAFTEHLAHDAEPPPLAPPPRSPPQRWPG